MPVSYWIAICTWTLTAAHLHTKCLHYLQNYIAFINDALYLQIHTFFSMNEYPYMVISKSTIPYQSNLKITIYHNLDTFTIISIFIKNPKYFATAYNFLCEIICSDVYS